MTDEGTLVIAVADGAGSAARAGEGARLAAAAGHAVLTDSSAIEADDWEAAVRRGLAAAREALEVAVEQACECGDTDLADFATTLAIVVATPELVAGGRVGDGCVVVRCGDQVALALAPERSEYLNETRFVTSNDWVDGIETFSLPATDLSGIAVLTDGLQLLALDMASGQPHAPFFNPLYAFVASTADGDGELADFLDSDRVNARTDDDKTLVVGVRG